MSKPIFVDTETTGLDRFTHEMWEVALIEPSGTEHLFHVEPMDIERADPKALEINRYHERTNAPDFKWHDPDDVASAIYEIMDGNHLVAANAEFDADFIEPLLLACGFEAKPWHYHQIDIEDELRGWLAATGNHAPLPFKSRDLVTSAGWGHLLPDADSHHTAMADARWVRDVWNMMYAGTPLEAF